MKFSFLFYLFLLQSTVFFAQSDARYHGYADKILQFSKPGRVLYNNINTEGNGYIEYTNPKKQILRFRVLSHKLQVLHGGISFQLFTYENDYLQKIETFDANGSLTGERESQNEAVVEFNIEKKSENLKKNKILKDDELNKDIKYKNKENIIKKK